MSKFHSNQWTITHVRAWEQKIQRQYHNIIQAHKFLWSYKNAVASVSYNYIFISYFFHNSVWVWSTMTVFVHVTKSWEGKDCKKVKDCFCLLLLIYFHCMVFIWFINIARSCQMWSATGCTGLIFTYSQVSCHGLTVNMGIEVT